MGGGEAVRAVHEIIEKTTERREYRFVMECRGQRVAILFVAPQNRKGRRFGSDCGLLP